MCKSRQKVFPENFHRRRKLANSPLLTVTKSNTLLGLEAHLPDRQARPWLPSCARSCAPTLPRPPRAAPTPRTRRTSTRRATSRCACASALRASGRRSAITTSSSRRSTSTCWLSIQRQTTCRTLMLLRVRCERIRACLRNVPATSSLHSTACSTRSQVRRTSLSTQPSM